MRRLHLVTAVLAATMAAAELTEVEIGANGDVHFAASDLETTGIDAEPFCNGVMVASDRVGELAKFCHSAVEL